MSNVRVGIVGPTGYAGMELVRLVAGHPRMTLVYLAGSGARTGPLDAHLPHLHVLADALPPVEPLDVHKAADLCDLVFVALPSGESGRVAWEIAQAGLDRGVKVIDLSGDLRLPPEAYEAWYGRPPLPREAIAQACYGLPERHRESIREASLVANPGCYATACALAVLPLGNLLADVKGPIVFDAKSGVTGAGRAPKEHLHLGELANDVYPYRVGQHQHTPEIEQALGGAVRVLLTTQLLPIPRGILVCAYIPIPPDEAPMVYDRYASFCEREPFVRLLPDGQLPHIKAVNGTNECHLAVRWDERSRLLQVFTAIDNLGKGAAGQAVQNANLMFGWPEREGLNLVPLWM
ncbi:N-acetyl-gamma-glutamyl-phosphate reductase [Alicyclobacillus acidocaldarius]|uniref:N-acetyl-gamma-glutamyl-phosphate reductase n=1 Tax=Alicyclobacillus acidocaldarius subsp. acidocaldarius (strain ATCC 27009 / DSM 446 / BCRC 14685 / JCM 5260 / KCTC 1825 / NBRC 15652 / NCIMB 11725 / NRRL B-14509 / 104-IA) TaxID=521098 RepID=C8WVX9_ALIAD|nr:N-acetyl-gamma-glutamyl-phosphate reductase [Alicyclobacillus acidocaldarius]ACV58251.1 N-acetyl-gamma-glutamyl-phosphate reductase [Alicyclobacillus acidocaldarius subsp. acidocaldarius DSM 446]